MADVIKRRMEKRLRRGCDITEVKQNFFHVVTTHFCLCAVAACFTTNLIFVNALTLSLQSAIFSALIATFGAAYKKTLEFSNESIKESKIEKFFHKTLNTH